MNKDHKNDGKELEGLVGKVYRTMISGQPDATVELDVKLTSTSGRKRQFDVLVRNCVAGIEIVIVIEVRDKSRKLILDDLDGFVTKLRSVNASKGIIVSRNGFAQSVIEDAKKYGVGLYTIQTLDDLSNLVPMIPSVVHCINFSSFSIDM